MIIYIPYTYLIGWSKHQKYYYGVRYAKGCQPNELWVNYKTSSKAVKKFAKEYGDPDIIMIRKTFKSADDARLWEHKVLKRMNVVNNDKFLNKTDNKSIKLSKEHYETMHTFEVRRKMSDKAKARGYNPDQLKAAREKIDYDSENWANRNIKISKALKGKSHNWNNSKTLKSLPKIECEYCKKHFNIGNYHRWHGDKCKLFFVSE